MQDSVVQTSTAAGLGLEYADLRLERTQRSWVTAGEKLAARVALALGALVAGVEPVGSAAVAGLLAEPIIDLAAGMDPIAAIEQITEQLEGAGWIYRGDAAQDGGHVFVLETRPRFRVAHLHADEIGGEGSSGARTRCGVATRTRCRRAICGNERTPVERSPA
jgi:GrpB-like predicted nucleotidyltransferase (UPF0157 family)